MTNHWSDDLILAVKEGDVDKTSALIATFGLSYSEAWSDGYTLLCNALDGKHTKIAKILLEHDSAVNSKEKRRMDTPLHLAVKNNDAEIVAMLLDRKANVDARNHLRETPLRCAIVEGNVEIVELLWRNNAPAHARSSKRIDALHAAADFGSTKIVEHLLNSGAFVDIAYERNGYTPLHCACVKDREEMVKLLLKRGANINAKTKNWSTPLHLAAAEKCDKIIKILLEHDSVNIDSQDENCKTAIDVAIRQGHLPTLRKILEMRPEVTKIEEHLKRSVDHSFTPNDDRCSSTIVKPFHLEGSPDSQKKGRTSLHYAVIKKRLHTAEMLIEHGADVNAIDKTGESVLGYVVSSTCELLREHDEDNYRDGLDLAELLLSRGAKVNAKGENGYSVLYIASAYGCDDMVEILLRYNADVNIVTDDWRMETPLHRSTKNEYKNISRMLLNAGAACNAVDGAGSTALVLACCCKDKNIIDILLEFGADIELKDMEGETPLLAAASCGNLEAVETFLESFADVECTNEYGETALQSASAMGHGKVVKELLDYGADQSVITCKECDSPIDYTTLGLNRCNEDQAERDFNFEHHDCVYDIDDSDDSFDVGESVKPSETIKRHIIKMKSLNIRDSKRNHASVGLNDELKDFQAECELEVGRMKSERIGERYISYHDILMKSVNQLAMVLRNKHIVEVLESSRYGDEFPIYYKMLYYKIKKGQKRGNLLNSSLRSFNFLSRFSLPELVSLKLLDMLSNKELEVLIKAGP